MVGEDVTIPETAVKSVVPMVYEDIVDAYRDAGFGRAAWAGSLNFFGMATNTYSDSKWRIRRDIQKMLTDGKRGEATEAARRWNAMNPTDQIKSVNEVELISTTSRPKRPRRDKREKRKRN